MYTWIFCSNFVIVFVTVATLNLAPHSAWILIPLLYTQMGYGQAVPGSLVFPPGEEDKFDWTCPNHQRRAASPDVVPNLFRPRKESLVDVAFDHTRAASGEGIGHRRVYRPAESVM